MSLQASALRATNTTSAGVVAKNSLFNLASEAWTFVLVIISVPILVHRLGTEAFGLFSLAWIVIGYLLFLDIGVNRATTKFVSAHIAKDEILESCTVIRTAMAANTVLGVMGAAAFASITPWMVHHAFKVSAPMQSDAALVFYAIAASLPALLLQGIFRSVLSSLQRFGAISVINSLTMTAQWGLCCFLAITDHGVAAVVISAVAIRVLAVVLNGIAMCWYMPSVIRQGSIRFSELQRMLGFGAWVSVSQVVSPFMLYLERIFIASMVSLQAVAVYTVPTEVMTRIRVIPSSISNTLFPALSERSEAHGGSGLLPMYQGSCEYLFAVLMPLSSFLFICGPDLLRVWVGASFGEQGASVMRILAFGAIVNCLAYIPYSVLQAANRPDLTGKFHLLEVPVHVAFCFLLIPRFGLNGAALAGTLRYVGDAALLFWAVKRVSGLSLSISRTVKVAAVSCVIISVAMVLSQLFVRGIYLRLACGASLACLYFVVFWKFGMDLRIKQRILHRVSGPRVQMEF